MSKTIWQYQFPIIPSFQLEMPLNAIIRSVQMQERIPTLWAEVDEDAEKELRSFRIFGTGHLLDDKTEYCGTIQDGAYVWHIYRGGKGE